MRILFGTWNVNAKSPSLIPLTSTVPIANAGSASAAAAAAATNTNTNTNTNTSTSTSTASSTTAAGKLPSTETSKLEADFGRGVDENKIPSFLVNKNNNNPTEYTTKPKAKLENIEENTNTNDERKKKKLKRKSLGKSISNNAKKLPSKSTKLIKHIKKKATGGKKKPKFKIASNNSCTLEAWLCRSSIPPDIVAVTIQEIVPLNSPTQYLQSSGSEDAASEWSRHICGTMNSTLQYKGTQYSILQVHSLIGLMLCVIVQTKHLPLVRNIRKSEASLGNFGLGNKGGVSIRFDLGSTKRKSRSFCFVGCHLSAGQREVLKRNEDYADIIKLVDFSSKERYLGSSSSSYTTSTSGSDTLSSSYDNTTSSSTEINSSTNTRVVDISTSISDSDGSGTKKKKKNEQKATGRNVQKKFSSDHRNHGKSESKRRKTTAKSSRSRQKEQLNGRRGTTSGDKRRNSNCNNNINSKTRHSTGGIKSNRNRSSKSENDHNKHTRMRHSTSGVIRNNRKSTGTASTRIPGSMTATVASTQYQGNSHSHSSGTTSMSSTSYTATSTDTGSTSRKGSKAFLFGGEETNDILSHDAIFWAGDLNYRLDGVGRDWSIQAIKAHNYQSLLVRDQLTFERANEHVFQGFKEGVINFAPSYKFVPGTNNYNTGEERKFRVPAWCDRVLWKSENQMVQQVSYYDAFGLNISDHKPVAAEFLLPLVDLSGTVGASWTKGYTNENRRSSRLNMDANMELDMEAISRLINEHIKESESSSRFYRTRSNSLPTLSLELAKLKDDIAMEQKLHGQSAKEMISNSNSHGKIVTSGSRHSKGVRSSVSSRKPKQEYEYEKRECVCAQHTFHARTSDELSMQQGDLIELYSEARLKGETWLLGRQMNNDNMGYFPVTYVKPMGVIRTKKSISNLKKAYKISALRFHNIHKLNSIRLRQSMKIETEPDFNFDKISNQARDNGVVDDDAILTTNADNIEDDDSEAVIIHDKISRRSIKKSSKKRIVRGFYSMLYRLTRIHKKFAAAEKLPEGLDDDITPEKLIVERVAKEAYSAKEQDELSFKRGDVITVVTRSETINHKHGWWIGIHLIKKEQGFVPERCFDPLPSADVQDNDGDRGKLNTYRMSTLFTKLLF